jgi:DNA-binding transcriptional LysR family regulator
MISSQYSPSLANALVKGTIDAAFLRREKGFPELAFRHLINEPLLAFLPSDHPLAALKAISPADLAGETFVTVSRTAAAVEQVSHRKTLTFEIGRVGRSRFQKGTLRLELNGFGRFQSQC